MTSALGALTPTPRPDPELRSVLPAPPVALRQFPQNDAVVVYGEAYDNQPTPPHKVDLTTTVTTADGRVVFQTASERDSSELHGSPGGYGFTARVPMKGLPIGPYVLRVAAQSAAGRRPVVTREIPFSVTAPLALSSGGR